MILNNENYNAAKTTHMIECICDYCNCNFTRRKAEIIRGSKNINKQCCNKKSCKSAKQIEVTQMKYGSTCSQLDPIVKAKTIETNLAKFGCENPFANSEIKNKIIKTNLTKFGETSFTKTEQYRQKSQETHEKKYGMHASKTKETQEKRKKTNILKYGVEFPSQKEEIKVKIFRDGNQRKVFKKTENEIKNFLNQYKEFNSNRDVLNGREIDLFCRELNLGIEYCGLYWHHEQSRSPRDRYYHWNKLIECRKKGIRLITIFSDEWVNKETQCKNFIKSILNIFDEKIYARKCIVKELTFKEVKSFCNEYHIQGSPRAILVAYGLIYKSELVGLISLSKHHRNRKEIVLNRLCYKGGLQVIGGSQKLFKQCVNWISTNKIESITTWSDNRWSEGNVYLKLNFKLNKELKPDYSYVYLNRPIIRLSKQSQKKNKNCPVDMTEKEWARFKGLARIWDCGKKKWVFNLPKNSEKTIT